MSDGAEAFNEDYPKIQELLANRSDVEHLEGVVSDLRAKLAEAEREREEARSACDDADHKIGELEREADEQTKNWQYMLEQRDLWKQRAESAEARITAAMEIPANEPHDYEDAVTCGNGDDTYAFGVDEGENRMRDKFRAILAPAQEGGGNG